MKRELLSDVWCPVCNGRLSITVEIWDGDEIVEGVLLCHHCGKTYPVKNSIPNLLPQDMRY